MSDLQSKTDEELNGKLAELAGYRWSMPEEAWYRNGNYFGRVLPKFCSSLDEVAKVEAGLTDEQWTEYLNTLYFITFVPGAKDRDRAAVGSKPRQRTIALIQTLQP